MKRIGILRGTPIRKRPKPPIYHSLNHDSLVRKYFEGKPRSFAVNLVKAVKFDPLFWRGFVLHMVRVCVSFGICSCIVDYFVTSEICRKWLNQPFFTFQFQLLYCRL